MLIRFLVSNFLSFKEEVEFSLVPGKPRKHPHHVIKGEQWNSINVLKSGVIYGANASGKTNLVKAMSFAQNLILEGTKPKRLIPATPFKLDKEFVNKQSSFTFEFKRKGIFYNYGFKLDSQRIYSEWLYEITKSSQKMLFERITNDTDETVVNLGSTIVKKMEDKEFMYFVAKGTRANQLYLTETINRGSKHFEDAFSWFAHVLIIIFPTSRYLGLETNIASSEALRKSLCELLQMFDTGISGVKLIDIDFESGLYEIPNEVKQKFYETLQPKDMAILVEETSGKRFLVVKNEENSIKTFKLVTWHKIKDTDEHVYFEINEESDGTQRLFDIIPALLILRNADRVFVIDELDRSIHPSICYKILDSFFKKPIRESQLIVTTHETNILDLELIRRDEIWFVEKNEHEASSVYSLEEFAPRYDKDIRKGYLHGRFGAIPVMGNVSDLGWDS